MTEKFSPAIPPEPWQARLELGGLRSRIPRIISPTISKTLERFRAGLGSGWIDMKFDPRDGGERDQGIDFYRKDRIYGWIQGRSLESMAAHAAWMKSAPLPGFPQAKELLGSGEALYEKLISVCLPASALSPRFYFVMDTEGKPPFGEEGEETTTLSQLFALRGLYAFAASRGKKADLERIGSFLRHAADEASRGRCRNDQVFFDPDGGTRRPPPRRGYEGQMIALGACEILYGHEGREEDLKRAEAIVEGVLSDFLYTNKDGEPTLAEYLDEHGRPLAEGGRVRSNPGHAIEFVGLSLQLFRRARLPLSSPRNLELLRRVAWRCARVGRAPHGGIYRCIDAEDGSPIDASCPWWSSFEAARTFAELSIAAGGDAEKLRCARTATSFVDTIETAYLGPSSLGIPVQTISADGKVLPAIPATPDLDSGYHNGIPLIDVLEVIDEAGCLFCGAAETELPARLGTLLQGHIARTGKARDQLDPLKARACRLAASGGQALLVSADVLEFSKAWAKRMERKLSALCGIRETEVFLFATHTHTAPASIDLGPLKRDKTFLLSLEAAMLEAARTASQTMSPAAPLFARAELGGLGINRRAADPASGKIVMRPNPEGPLDDSASSLLLVDAAGAPKALLFNMAIHPTSLGVSLASISADYPGLAAGLLGEALGGAIALPLQGACGDLRPNITAADGAEFAEGRYEDARRLAAGLAKALLASLAHASRAEQEQARWLDSCAVKVKVKNVLMPFGSPPSLSELGDLISRCEARIEEAGPPAPGTGLAAIHDVPSAPPVQGALTAAQGTMTAQSLAPLGAPSVRELSITQGAPSSSAPQGFSATHDAPLLEAKSFLAWARRVKRQSFDAQGRYKGPESARARFGLVSLGKELQLFAVPGELFSRIGMDLKKRALPAELLVCGYSGGTVGYIPSEEAFSQGGYEVESAYRYYGAPAALSPDTEARIHAIFEALRREVEP